MPNAERTKKALSNRREGGRAACGAGEPPHRINPNQVNPPHRANPDLMFHQNQAPVSRRIGPRATRRPAGPRGASRGASGCRSTRVPTSASPSQSAGPSQPGGRGLASGRPCRACQRGPVITGISMLSRPCAVSIIAPSTTA